MTGHCSFNDCNYLFPLLCHKDINPYEPNLSQLGESILVLRVFGWCFSIVFKF